MTRAYYGPELLTRDCAFPKVGGTGSSLPPRPCVGKMIDMARQSLHRQEAFRGVSTQVVI